MGTFDGFSQYGNSTLANLSSNVRPGLRASLERHLTAQQFHKTNPSEILAGPQELPSVTDPDYQFHADRDPPILAEAFSASFYGCKKACIKSRLDMLSLFHECKGRNHCGKYRVLERLPKRRKEWEIDQDQEKDEAWGLNAVLGISFCKVVLYHVLFFAGPMTFWGCWLKKWPTDWQNASVPFFAMMMLLSIFWFPFTHNPKSAHRDKRLKIKSE